MSNIKELEINNEIRDSEIRLIDEEGNQLGVMATSRALEIAIDKDLDLVKVAPNAVPPVCRILNYGKYKYEMQKKDKEAKKNQTIIKVKEIKMTPNIDTHDMSVKATKAREFIEDGNKVKVSIKFRGRQMGHPELGEEVLKLFFDEISDVASIDKAPKIEGRNMVMYIMPK